MILGIDEVGRGPWAGPLVVGAVILGGAEIEGLNDSKKLTKKRREVLDEAIREQSAAWALGWVSAGELDDVGMSQALRLATRRAVKQIQSQCKEKNLAFDEIIIDGTVNFLADTALEQYVTVMAKADGLIPSVSAASIIAKVARDQFMAEQDALYPGYGFKSNAGYGVAKHRAAIEQLGVTPLHRLSFAPLQKYVGAAGSPPSSSRVHSSLVSPPEILRERSAETSALRERFTASGGEGDASTDPSLSDPSSSTDSSELSRLTHLTIKKVTRDIEDEKFNTAVAAMMEMVNGLYKFKETHGIQVSETWRFALESLLQILAPFAPHITEELWHELGYSDTIHVDHWPKWDEKYLASDTMTIIVQVNGKLRAKLELPADTDKDAIEQAALADENVIKFTSNKPPKKVIYVPKKLVNIVV